MKKWDFNENNEFSNDVPQFDYRKILDTVKENWFGFISCLFIAITIAFVLNRYTTPIYIVRADMLIKSEKENTNPVADLLYGKEFFARNATNLENEATLFKARILIEKTVKSLGFEVSYFNEGDVKNDELYKQSLIKIDVYPSSSRIDYQNLFRCQIINAKKYYLDIVDQRNFIDKSLDRISGESVYKPFGKERRNYNFGDTVEIKNFQFVINIASKLSKKDKGQMVLFKFNRLRRLISQYRSNLKVEPLSLESSVLKISIEGSVPEKSIDFINTLMDNYIINELDRKNESAEKTINFINKQIVFMSDSLSTIEDRLEGFKKVNAAIDLSEEGTKLYSASQELVLEKSEINREIKFLEDLEKYILKGNLEQIITPSSLGIDDPTLNSLILELGSIVADINTMEAANVSNNPLLRQAKIRITPLKERILENINAILSTSRYQLEDVERNLAGLQNSMRRLPTAERELIDIERTHALSESLYIFLLEKKAEAGIARASNTIDYRIIDRAEIQGIAPVKPSPILNYLVAILLGSSIPGIFLFFKALVNNKITSKEEISKLTKIPVLGVVAHDKYAGNLVVQDNPKSAISESLRTIRSNLRYLSSSKGRSNIYLITSSVSGEGKSFVSRNLAFLFASLGKKTIIINADLRKNHSPEAIYLGNKSFSNSLGLSDYLAEIIDKEELIQKTNFQNLYIIAPGGIPPNPSELLISDRFKDLLQKLKLNFDYIFLDTPPVGLLSDGLEMMDLADYILFVVRQGLTLKEDLVEADKLFKNGRYKNMAVILNDTKMKRNKYGYGYYQEIRPKPRNIINRILKRPKEKIEG